MRQLKDYNKDIYRLVNSLIIKIDMVDTYIEDNISNLYGTITEEDKNKHKYYMNLKGEKHFTNSDINIYVPDIDKETVITKDNINDYPILKNELLKFDTFFNSIMKQYPKDNSYIRGILNPINDPVNVDDGIILYYDKNLLKDEETSVIFRIEKFIKNILITNNRRYVVDNLYVPSFLGVLYNLLPILIYLFRSKNIRTSEVSDFDLYSFLGSYKRIEETDLTFINNKNTILWLYSNLPYLKKELGSNYTLDRIIDKVYDKNNIGIANIKIFNKNPNLIIDNVEDNKKLFFTNDYSLKNIPVNKSYKLDNLDTDINEIMYLENYLGYTDIDTLNKIDDYDEKLKTIVRSSGTKAYVFDNVDIRIGYNTTILTLVFNNLMYYLRDDRLIFGKTIINPSNGLPITLNSKSIFYLTLGCFTIMQGGKLEDTFIESYSCDGLLNPRINREMLVKNTILGEALYPIVDKFIFLASKIKTPITAEDFNNNLEIIKSINTLVWYYITNSNDIVISSDLRLVIERLYLTKEIEEDKTKSLQTLLEENIRNDEVVYIDPQKTFETLALIYDEVFGIKVDEYYLIDLQYKQYVKFINKFKSYTIQFLYNNTFTNTVFNYFTTINIGSQNKTLIDVYDVRFKRFTKIDSSLSSVSLAFTDKNVYFRTMFNSINNIDVDDKPKLLSLYSKILDMSDINLNFYNNEILETKLRSSLRKKNIINENGKISDSYKYLVEIDEFLDTYINSDIESIVSDGSYTTISRETISRKMSSKIKNVFNETNDIDSTSIVDIVDLETDKEKQSMSYERDLVGLDEVKVSKEVVDDKLSSKNKILINIGDDKVVSTDEENKILDVYEYTDLETSEVNVIEDGGNVYSKETYDRKMGTNMEIVTNIDDVNYLENETTTNEINNTDISITTINDVVTDSETLISNDSVDNKLTDEITTSIVDDNNLDDNQITQESTIDDLNNSIIVEDLSNDVIEVNEITISDTI